MSWLAGLVVGLVLIPVAQAAEVPVAEGNWRLHRLSRCARPGPPLFTEQAVLDGLTAAAMQLLDAVRRAPASCQRLVP